MHLPIHIPPLVLLAACRLFDTWVAEDAIPDTGVPITEHCTHFVENLDDLCDDVDWRKACVLQCNDVALVDTGLIHDVDSCVHDGTASCAAVQDCLIAHTFDCVP